MQDPSWFDRLKGRVIEFIQRLRYDSSRPGTPEFEAKLKAEAEMDQVRRSQRDDQRRFGDSMWNPF